MKEDLSVPPGKCFTTLGDWMSTLDFPSLSTIGLGNAVSVTPCQPRAGDEDVSLFLYPSYVVFLGLWGPGVWPPLLRFWDFHSGVLSTDSCQLALL